MVSEGTTTRVNRMAPIEGVALCNGPRMAPLVEADGPDVEVINLHVSRARIKPGIWPRHFPVDHLPRSLRVIVRTPDGVWCPVRVQLTVVEGYVYAAGHQEFICNGEDVQSGGAFPRESELEAESRALAML